MSALLQLILHAKYWRQQPPLPTELERTLLDKDTGAQEETHSTNNVRPPLPTPTPSGFDKSLIELDASATIQTPRLPPTLQTETLVHKKDTTTVKVSQTPPPPPTLQAETLVDKKDTATVEATQTPPPEQLPAPADAVA